MKDRVAQALSWVKQLGEATKAQKRKLKRLILRGLLEEGHEYLYHQLEDEYEFIGFPVGQIYLSENDQSYYVHPWGSPPLMYKHKELPMIVIVGPGIEYNDSVLKKMNPHEYWGEIVGITG